MATHSASLTGAFNHGFVDSDDEQWNNNMESSKQTDFCHKSRSESAVSFNKALDSVEIITEEKACEAKHLVTFSDILLAATLIQDAMYGRNIPHKSDPNSIRSYKLYNGWLSKAVLYSAIGIVLGLALFEKPAIYGWEAPYWATLCVECVCLFIFIGRFLHNLHFVPENIFWRDKKNIVILVVLALTWLDMTSYVIVINIDENYAIRWSRALRPLFIINFSDGRQIRRAFRNIRRTLVDIMNVLILFAFCIVLFALLGFKLFHKRHIYYPNGQPYFSNYMTCLWDLYVLVTTANNPDVMMPAYDRNNLFAIFFILYVLCTNYVFMSILLAVIYNNYRKHLKNEVKSYVFHKRQLLGGAFDVLKVKRNGRYVVAKDDWHLLMKVMSPEKSSTQVDLLLFVLDENGDGMIERGEFLKVADLLNVHLSEISDEITLFEKYLSGCYMSNASEFVKMCINHRFFRYFFDFCIVVNAICIGLTLDDAEWIFLALFVLEILLKVYAKGFKKFCKSYWNLFDTVIIFAAVIATSVESIESEYLEEENTLDILLVLRVLRLIKLIGSVKRFKIIITTIMNIGPSIMTYGGVIFVFYYIYAIIGMELFSNLVKFYGYGNGSKPFCGNPALNGSDFYSSGYCSNNFNDIMKAFVILFELMYVNQWHVLTNGFVLVTNEWAKLYFISFHMFCVLLVLNIFVAFILEAFILEYNLSSGKIENAIETKIKEMGLNMAKKNEKKITFTVDKKQLTEHEIQASPGIEVVKISPIETENGTPEARRLPEFMKTSDLRFHLRKKSRKTVLTLLQAMFENELSPEDLGPDNFDDDDWDDDDDRPMVGNSKFFTL